MQKSSYHGGKAIQKSREQEGLKTLLSMIMIQPIEERGDDEYSDSGATDACEPCVSIMYVM